LINEDEIMACFDAKFDIGKFDISKFDILCHIVTRTTTSPLEPPMRTSWGVESSLLIER